MAMSLELQLSQVRAATSSNSSCTSTVLDMTTNEEVEMSNLCFHADGGGTFFAVLLEEDIRMMLCIW